MDTFLGEWLEQLNESTIFDILLFKELLLCQKNYNENNIIKAKNRFKIALKHSLSHNFEIHPILKARLAVWDMILNNNQNRMSEYFFKLKNPYDIADFIVISFRLLWIYNKDIPENLNTQINSIFPVVKDYFQKGRHNILLLTLAIYFYKKNELKSSKHYFSQVNTTTFGYDIVNIEFYENWIDLLK